MVRISLLELPNSIRKTKIYRDCNRYGAVNDINKNEYDYSFERFARCTLDYDNGEWTCVFTEDDYIWFVLTWL